VGKLEGKVALLTGAARGQGEAEARLFAAEGARVVVADVLDEQAQEVARDLGDAGLHQHLDVSRPEQWDAAIAATRDRFGRLDVLINNAGILRTAAIEAMPLDDYLSVIQVNQVGCWLGMKAVAPAMRAGGGGTIVNVSSVAGLEGYAGMSAYVASKFAVRGMTKVAALEFGPLGIRVNSIHPGAIDTPMIRRPEFRDPNDWLPHSGLPIPRVGLPEEVAKLALFLASDDSSYCTGAEFVIDGGSLAGSTAT
jgi:3alpha(or 20beta)-hydroxysteroid dehydrogenase